MDAQQIAQKIERDFFVTHAPSITRVIYKNRESIDGFFQSYIDDALELRKQLKFRFIPMGNASALRDEFDKTGTLNKKYSIIVDATEVEDVILV